MIKFLLSLINTNNMNIQIMKQKILNYQNKYKTKPFHIWGGTSLSNWEYKLLTDIKAISHSEVIAHYPVVQIKKEDGTTTAEDLGGDIERTKQAVDGFNSGGNKGFAKVLLYAKNFYLFREAQQELLKEKIEKKDKLKYALEINRVPLT